MPKLLADFNAAVVGRKILKAGYVNIGGMPYPAIILGRLENEADTKGECLIIQADDECNGPGTVILSKSDAVLCACGFK